MDIEENKTNVKEYMLKVRAINKKIKYLKLMIEQFDNAKISEDNIEYKAAKIQYEELVEEMNKFIKNIFTLTPEEIEIALVYVDSSGYDDILEKIKKKGFSEKNYSRIIRIVRSKLSKIVTEEDCQCIENANNRYIKRMG